MFAYIPHARRGHTLRSTSLNSYTWLWGRPVLSITEKHEVYLGDLDVEGRPPRRQDSSSLQERQSQSGRAVPQIDPRAILDRHERDSTIVICFLSTKSKSIWGRGICVLPCHHKSSSPPRSYLRSSKLLSTNLRLLPTHDALPASTIVLHTSPSVGQPKACLVADRNRPVDSFVCTTAC